VRRRSTIDEAAMAASCLAALAGDRYQDASSAERGGEFDERGCGYVTPSAAGVLVARERGGV
jgi:hypothetical protein